MPIITKLDFTKDYLESLSPSTLQDALIQCASTLERLRFCNASEPANGQVIRLLLAAVSESKFQKISRFPILPQLTELEFHSVETSPNLFQRLVENAPSLRVITWNGAITQAGFPLRESLESFGTIWIDDYVIKSMVGKVPNLKRFRAVVYGNAAILDEFFGHVRKLQSVDLTAYTTEFHIRDVRNFWNLRSLTSLNLSRMCAVGSGRELREGLMSDDDVKKIVSSFPLLDELQLNFSNVTARGLSELRSSAELRVLISNPDWNPAARFPQNQIRNNLDAGFQTLVHCRHLREIIFDEAVISADNLSSLTRECTQLCRISIFGVGGVSTPQKAADVLKSICGCAARNIDIRLAAASRDIWTSPAVQANLEDLKKHDSVVIKFYFV